MVRLILTRHGETEENIKNIMQGILPGKLSQLGIKQAHDLADSLSDIPIDVIISSDLARSYDTASVVGKSKNLDVIQTPLLREIDWGPMTGGILTKVDWNHLPEGTEQLDQLYCRAGMFIDYVIKNFSGKTVLAVGHGAIDRAITAYLSGMKCGDMIDLPIIKNTFCQEYLL